MASLLGLAWARYCQRLEKQPLPTKAITAGCLSAASDVIAQSLTSKNPLNLRRTLALGAFGFFWSGPSNHFWQGFLQRMFPKQTDSNLVRKVVIDQITYGPVCNLALMSFLALVVDGRSFKFTANKLRSDFWSVQRNGWKFWPLVAVLNYRYVPLKLRVLVINLAAFCWSTFLIVKSHGKALVVK